ncbi:MAG: DsrE family protein [Actinomycetota bacterium]|nr:DsrE family protein [Actinomycetota bacterium]
MPQPDGPPHDLSRLIDALDRHGVKYLVCGGAAAQAYGVDRPTEDADCVVRCERANLDRLAAAMRELHARLRVANMSDDEARLLPVHLDGATLADLALTTWMTDAGPFDVLDGLKASDGRVVTYEELAGRATVLRGDGPDPSRERGRSGRLATAGTTCRTQAIARAQQEPATEPLVAERGLDASAALSPRPRRARPGRPSRRRPRAPPRS